MKDYIMAFKNIFNYKDETSRKAFWNFFAINIIVNIIVRMVVKYWNIPETINNIYTVIITLALVSIGFRRLKNAGLNGFLFLIPLVNLVLAALPEKKK